MSYRVVELKRESIVQRNGLAFAAAVPFAGKGDTLDAPSSSSVRLFEDGSELGPGHSMHATIEDLGGGAFSHWDEMLVFSTSDGSSPFENGRNYQILFEQDTARDHLCGLEMKAFMSIQKGVLNYKYKGRLCCKSPFDMALYQMLLAQLRPRTIIEFGTLEGGSALWFADQLRLLGVEGQIHSVDVNEPAPIRDALVTFHKADVLRIDEYLPRAWIGSLPKPLLIVEDAGHTYSMTMSVLEHVAPVVRSGEYIVVEDGIMSPMNAAHLYDGGPLRATREFLKKHSEFEVDRTYCDYYGRNVTWNIDGYLRRI
jgi:cephalosporin hydroxylase